MAAILRVFLFFLLLTFQLCAETVPNKLFIKLRPYSGSLQSRTLGSSSELPASIKALNAKYRATKVKLLAPANRGGYNRMANLKSRSHQENFIKIEYQDDISPTDLAAIYEKLPEVELAQPIYVYSKIITPDDPALTGNYQDNAILITNPEPAWDITTGDSSLKLAIIDTGVSLNHADLIDNKWINVADPPGGPGDGDDDSNGYIDDTNGWDFANNDNDPQDDEGHGTMVAGVAAARGNNGIYMAGACWDVKIMSLKVLNYLGQGNGDDLIDAVNYCINMNVDVVNMSLGQLTNDPALEAACNDAEANGILLIAAMGNVGGATERYSEVYPAAFSSVMGVGATDSNDELTEFSVVGSAPNTTEITAPGDQIVSLVYNNATASTYFVASGTSLASPIVAGIACLVKSTSSTLNNNDIRSRLNNSADDLGRPGKDDSYGYGRINALNAVTNTPGSAAAINSPIKDLFNYPNPVLKPPARFIFSSQDDVNKVTTKIFDFRGKLLKTLETGASPAGSYRWEWDLKDETDTLVLNGSYIYVVKIDTAKGSYTYKEIISIVR